MRNVGLDIHKVQTQVCILEEDGEVREQRIRTTRESLEKIFGAMDRSRILLEACTESEWGARLLESFGHEAIVADPNYAPMYGERRRRVKTDVRDARVFRERDFRQNGAADLNRLTAECHSSDPTTTRLPFAR